MFGIINQLYLTSKDDDNTISGVIEGMKKPFLSILYLYETNNLRGEVRWERSPPIDTMIKRTKNIFWNHILRVSINVHSSTMSEIIELGVDDDLTYLIILAFGQKVNND